VVDAATATRTDSATSGHEYVTSAGMRIAAMPL